MFQRNKNGSPEENSKQKKPNTSHLLGCPGILPMRGLKRFDINVCRASENPSDPFEQFHSPPQQQTSPSPTEESRKQTHAVKFDPVPRLEERKPSKPSQQTSDRRNSLHGISSEDIDELNPTNHLATKKEVKEKRPQLPRPPTNQKAPTASKHRSRSASPESDNLRSLALIRLVLSSSGENNVPFVPFVGGRMDPIVIVRDEEGNLWDDDDPSPRNPVGNVERKARLEYRWYRGPAYPVCTFHAHLPAKYQCVETYRCYCSLPCFKQGHVELRDHFAGKQPLVRNSNLHSYGVPCKGGSYYDAYEDLLEPSDHLHLSLLRKCDLLHTSDDEDTYTLVSIDRSYVAKPEDISHPFKLEAFLIPMGGNQQSSFTDISGTEDDHLSTRTKPVFCKTIITACTVDLPHFHVKPNMTSLLSVDEEPSTLSVVSWNCLADIYSNPDVFPTAEPFSLSWSYRKRFILRDIISYNPDVVCLQEVQDEHFHDFFYPKLSARGFGAIYKGKTRDIYSGRSGRRKGKFVTDGCATFFRKDKFRLLDSVGVEYRTIMKELSLVLFSEELEENPNSLKRSIKDNVGIILALELLPNTREHAAQIKTAIAPIAPDPANSVDPAVANTYSEEMHYENIPESVDVYNACVYEQNCYYPANYKPQPVHPFFKLPSTFMQAEIYDGVGGDFKEFPNTGSYHQPIDEYPMYSDQHLWEAMYGQHNYNPALPYTQTNMSTLNNPVWNSSSEAQALVEEPGRTGQMPIAIITNTHVVANPSAVEAKLWQTEILLGVIEDYVGEALSSSSWPPTFPGADPDSTTPRRSAKAPQIRRKDRPSDRRKGRQMIDKVQSLYGRYIALNVLAGDFNSPPDSAVYELIATGQTNVNVASNPTESEDPLFRLVDFRHSTTFTSAAAGAQASLEDIDINQTVAQAFAHWDGAALSSATAKKREEALQKMKNWEPAFTIPTARFTGCLDYVFYDPSKSKLAAVAQVPTKQQLLEEARVLRRLDYHLPSPIRPSDHIPLFASFIVPCLEG